MGSVGRAVGGNEDKLWVSNVLGKSVDVDPEREEVDSRFFRRPPFCFCVPLSALTAVTVLDDAGGRLGNTRVWNTGCPGVEGVDEGVGDPILWEEETRGLALAGAFGLGLGGSGVISGKGSSSLKRGSVGPKSLGSSFSL